MDARRVIYSRSPHMNYKRLNSIATLAATIGALRRTRAARS